MPGWALIKQREVPQTGQRGGTGEGGEQGSRAERGPRSLLRFQKEKRKELSVCLPGDTDNAGGGKRRPLPEAHNLGSSSRGTSLSADDKPPPRTRGPQGQRSCRGSDGTAPPV